MHGVSTTLNVKKRYMFSAEGMAELKAIHAHVLENVRLALNVFTTRDLSLDGHLTSVAYPILEAAGKLANTRLKTAQPLMRAPLGS